MNIRITNNWLLEYLDTDATPHEIQKYLSLSGPSVERVEKIGDDYVYDIEIISNRIDSASVLGIAQEAVAILPMFGKRAQLRFDPLKKYRFKYIVGNRHACSLQVQIIGKNLCSRFTAIVIDDIHIKPSPSFISQRVLAAGIKSINNVVDISNYLMLALGQPVHVFDYDRIGRSTMIMRESKKGEKIVTLDGKELSLPGGDIVIEDGDGKLIDLCGIMGGLNSAINEKTQRAVLFVQTYNKERIRRTTMTTGVRTVAATFFEKGLDEERVEPTTAYGVELLQKHAGGKIASKIYDIYPNPYRGKTVQIPTTKFKELMGVEIPEGEVKKILTDLGFSVEPSLKEYFTVAVPSYRKYDVSIPEDLVEEVARVYGYHRLPNNLPPPVYIRQPEEFEKLFTITSRIKYFLKHLGLTEVINYSMISKDMIKSYDFDPENALRLSNTISNEIEYMRRSLLPSLIKNIKENQGKREVLRFFEISKIYHAHKDNLPDEVYKLGIGVNTDFLDLKGIIDSLLNEFHIENTEIKRSRHPLLNQNVQGELYIYGRSICIFGQLDQKYELLQQLSKPAYLAQIDIRELIRYAKQFAKYRPINQFATIKLDLTIEMKEVLTYEEIKKKSFDSSKLLEDIEVITLYRNKLSLRFYFTSYERNITEKEAKKEFEKIKRNILS